MTAREILEAITRLRTLVVGDVCLDRWCRYDPSTSEPSRETGIPRIGVVATDVTPGAAGTVANNLRALGARKVAALGVIGDDGFGFELSQALAAHGISSDFAVRSNAVPTFTYTKLINGDTGEEDRPRVDFINTRPVPDAVEAAVLANLREAWPDYDVVLVSDQAETEAGGVVTPAVRAELGGLAASHPSKIVWVDSRMRAELFRNVILKCNDDEAAAALRRAGATDLRAHTGAPLVIVTHGRLGARVLDGSGEHWVRTAHIEKPVDICGAGDSFSAGAALALAITGSPLEAARFGNIIASITIMKKGTGSASPNEVLEAERRWPE